MSRIEKVISEIEEYIEGCKYQPLSNTKILVNKDEFEELIVELRMVVPEEIKKFQKIVSNKDAIIDDARTQADSMLAEVTARTNQLVNDHEITQRANQNADIIFQNAQAQAHEIVNGAILEANNVRENSILYSDQLLAGVQGIIENTKAMTQERLNIFINDLNINLNTINDNRMSLSTSIRTKADEYLEEN